MVVVDDAGHAIDVPSRRLPAAARSEGAILHVPLDEAGNPRWEDAFRDRAEERRRRAALADRVRRLEATDRGGDIEL